LPEPKLVQPFSCHSSRWEQPFDGKFTGTRKNYQKIAANYGIYYWDRGAREAPFGGGIMSDHKSEADEGHRHHHPEVEIERIETVSSTTTPWTVRLIFGILGLVFLATALAAWQFRAMFDGHVMQALPYIIAGLGVLGIGAIVESITTEIWIALIAGVIALAVTFLIVGRSQLVPVEGSSLFVVDRFTSAVQFCTQDGCKPLPQVAELPKPAPFVLPEPPPPPADAVQPAAGLVPPTAGTPVPPPVTTPAPVVTPPPAKAPAKTKP